MKLKQQLPVELRGQAADCMVMEAYSRVQNPVYGSVGIIHQLQQEIIEAQKEIIKIQGEIAFYSAQFQHQHLQQSQKNAEQQHQDSFFSDFKS